MEFGAVYNIREQSTGITAEINFARSLGLPIVYWTCDDYNEEKFYE